MNWLETTFKILREKWTWIRCKFHPASHIITQDITIQLLKAERDNLKNQQEQLQQLLNLERGSSKRFLQQIVGVVFLLYNTEDILTKELSRVTMIDKLKLLTFLRKKNELGQQFLNLDPDDDSRKLLFKEAKQLFTETKENGFWTYRLPSVREQSFIEALGNALKKQS